MEVARMFLASGVRASLVALALGLPLSIAALRIGMSQGVVIAPKVNPYLIGVVIAPVLLAVASAATWVPARRAALVDPARTLRVERSISLQDLTWMFTVMTPMNVNLAVQKRTRLVCATVSSSVPGAIRLIRGIRSARTTLCHRCQS